MKPEYLWLAYWIGAIAALAWKWVRWCLIGDCEYNKSWRQSTKEWFSLALREEQVSWVVTVGIVWVVGAVFVQRIEIDLDLLKYVPVHYSTAFLLGSLMEFVVPAVFKWLLSKLPKSD